jgi:hypothetical protein
MQPATCNLHASKLRRGLSTQGDAQHDAQPRWLQFHVDSVARVYAKQRPPQGGNHLLGTLWAHPPVHELDSAYSRVSYAMQATAGCCTVCTASASRTSTCLLGPLRGARQCGCLPPLRSRLSLCARALRSNHRRPRYLSRMREVCPRSESRKGSRRRRARAQSQCDSEAPGMVSLLSAPVAACCGCDVMSFTRFI